GLADELHQSLRTAGPLLGLLGGAAAVAGKRITILARLTGLPPPSRATLARQLGGAGLAVVLLVGGAGLAGPRQRGPVPGVGQVAGGCLSGGLLDGVGQVALPRAGQGAGREVDGFGIGHAVKDGLAE